MHNRPEIPGNGIGITIESVEPPEGFRGTALTIYGKGFSDVPEENHVTIGGKKAIVYEATPTMLKVLSDPAMDTGKITVQKGDYIAHAGINIVTQPMMLTGLDPPLSSIGMDLDYKRNVPRHEGPLRILVVLVYPTDKPRNTCPLPSKIQGIWADVIKYYRQASYGDYQITVDVTPDWYPLLGNTNDYISNYGQQDAEIKLDLLFQYWSEVAQCASNYLKTLPVNNDGNPNNDITLGSYDILVGVINLGGKAIRGFGGYSTSHFLYKDENSGVNIDIPVNTKWGYINLIAMGDNTNNIPNRQWTRCVHEVGHCILSSPDLGDSPGSDTLDEEDLYPVSNIPGMDYSAAEFDIMGRDVRGPLFSAYNMEQLGFYRLEDDATPNKNIATREWSDFSGIEIFEVVAHGIESERNTTTMNSANQVRCNLIKIPVCEGLCYYVEVRDSYVYYDNPPLFDGNLDQSQGAAYIPGGVVVTAVVSKTVHNNQYMRFITVINDTAHTPNPLLDSTNVTDPNPPMPVMKDGQTATDPLRGFKITVLKYIRNKPLAFLVQLEKLRQPTATNGGKVDLFMNKGTVSWESPDIFIDAFPCDGRYEQCDSQGNPVGNGDRPRAGRPNALHAVVHYGIRENSAPHTAHARIHYYYISPSVGDNGVYDVRDFREGDITASATQPGKQDFTVVWTPAAGEHTCIKVVVDTVSGEYDVTNNVAQENVFDFDLPYSKARMPAFLKFVASLRNPLNRSATVLLSFNKLPPGFIAYYPKSSLIMGPSEKRDLELLVVPTEQYEFYRKNEIPKVKVRLKGYVVDPEVNKVFPGLVPVEEPLPIGGVTINCWIKPEVKLSLEGTYKKGIVILNGCIKPSTSYTESVYTEIYDRVGNVWAQNVNTDGQGNFMAIFDPSTKPQAKVKGLTIDESIPAIKPVLISKKVLERATMYAGSAELIYSRHAARAQSDTVYIIAADQKAPLTGRKQPGSQARRSPSSR